jgi:hypothetical protein
LSTEGIARRREGFTPESYRQASIETVARSEPPIIFQVFSKKTEAAPKTVVDRCRQRLAPYRLAASEKH